MLISFTVSPDNAKELTTVLSPLNGHGVLQITINQDSEDFHTVDVNFEDEADPTPWQVVRLIATAIELGF